jgi:hypothetical protein
MDLETIKGLWRSWALLVGGTITFSALWLLPAEWIPDPAVANVHAQYRGFVGFAALCFVALTGARAIVKISTLTARWIQGIPERRTRKEHRRALEDRILRRVPRLAAQERELLKLCLEEGNPEIVVDAGDPRTEQGFRVGLLTAIECEIGDPKHKFRIHPWAWERLRRDHSHLLEAADEFEGDR